MTHVQIISLEVEIPDVDTLQEEVDECETTIETLTESWKTLNAERDAKLRESEDSKTLMTDVDERCVAGGEQLERCKDEMVEIEEHIAKLRKTEAELTKKLGELRKLLEKATVSVVSSVTDLEKTRSQAEQYCDEVPTSGKSVKTLTVLITKTRYTMLFLTLTHHDTWFSQGICHGLPKVGPLPEATPTESDRRIWSDLVGFGRIPSDSVGFGQIQSDSV